MRIDDARAEHLHERLVAAPIARVDPEGLGQEAWRLADEFGWGRTYDAEYVALAKLLGCRLVTLDTRASSLPRSSNPFDLAHAATATLASMTSN